MRLGGLGPGACGLSRWRPGAIGTAPEDGRHRDTLFSVAFRRSFGDQPFRPTLAHPQQVLVSCSDPDVVERRQERFVGTSLFPLVSAGNTGRGFSLVCSCRAATGGP